MRYGQAPLFVESCSMNILDSLRTGPYLYQTSLGEYPNYKLSYMKTHSRARLPAAGLLSYTRDVQAALNTFVSRILPLILNLAFRKLYL